MWDIFEISSSEEETVSNAYSSRGIFKIRSSEEVSKRPNVLASIQNERVVIVIDKSMALLEDEMVAKYSFLNFDAPVDCFTLSQSGNVVICGLTNGEIHGVFIKGVLLFTLNVRAQDVHLTGKTFANVQQFGKDFYLNCTNGSIYRLGAVDESVLLKNNNRSLSDNETVAIDESVLENISLQRLEDVCTPKFATITCATMLLSKADARHQFLAGSANKIYLADSYVAQSLLPEKYGEVKRIYNLENYILFLTTSGLLVKVCPITKVISYPLDGMQEKLIDDLIVMECNDDNIELLIVTKPLEDDGMRAMKFVEYPSLKCLSELDVPKESWLIQQPKSSVNLYYLIGSDLNAQNMPTEIEMMLVSETHPSERFKKLIAKGHFDEAETFGKQFELCLQPVYEARAKRMMVSLSSLANTETERVVEAFDELLPILSQIESHEFFRNNHSINLPSRRLLERFLNEMLRHLDKEEDEKHMLDIREKLRRLETLKLIDPDECDGSWQKFVYNYNLVSYVIALLKINIPNACLIWKRHSCVMISHLDSEDLKKLLSIIPNDTEPFQIVQWLRQFVPVVCNTHPDVMPFVTQWSIEKTRSLQYSEHWPEIGLEFATSVLEILDEPEFLHSDVRRQQELNVMRLNDTVVALRDLSVLQKDYNLRFTLDNYLQDSIQETALCILQRAHLANIKSLVNDFLNPIFQKNGTTPANALCRYIKLLVARRSSLRSWLERAVSCIELLHNEDDRLDTALTVLQNSPVPWPDTVTPLVKLRNTTHPLAIKINTEYEMQFLKIMKVKYGWPANSPTDTETQLNTFMLRILKVDLPEMLDDVRTLTKMAPAITISANFNCCYQLVKKGRLDEAFDFFKSLTTPAPTTSAISTNTNSDFSLLGAPSHDNLNFRNNVIDILGDVLEKPALELDEAGMQQEKDLMEFYKQIVKFSQCKHLEKRFSLIQSRYVLQRKFDIKINEVFELVGQQRRADILEKAIDNIMSRCAKFSERSENTLITKYLINELSELCGALSFSKVRGASRLCSRAQNLLLTCAMAHELLQLEDCNASNSRDFIDLALELIVQEISSDKKSTSFGDFGHSLWANKDLFAFGLAHDLLAYALLYEKEHPFEVIELLQYLTIVHNCYGIRSIKDFYDHNYESVNESIRSHFCSLRESNTSRSFEESSKLDAKLKDKKQCVAVFDQVEIEADQQQQVELQTPDGCKNIVRFMARTLSVLLLTVEPTNPWFARIRSSLLSVNPELNLQDATKRFFTSQTQLLKARVFAIWYTTLQYLMEYQSRHSCDIIHKSLLTLELPRILRHALSKADVDFIELLLLIRATDQGDAVLKNIETELKSDQQKMNFLTLTEMLHESYQDKVYMEFVRSKRITHYYYMEFCKQDPTLKGKFNVETDDVSQLLKLFQNKRLDVQLLEKMSNDFVLDFDNLLIKQVTTTLQSQELQYEIKIDAFGDEELVVLSSAEDIRRLCEPYIKKIGNVELLKTELKHFIKEINFYFYELYLCVIEMLSMLYELPDEIQIWTSILRFLQHKMIRRRRNRAGQAEIDVWLQSQTEMGVLPKIARYRFPFRPIVEQPLKDILDAEIYVDNCESWFPLVAMHTALKGSKDVSKSRDYFCMQAVNNSISEHKSKNDAETWNIQPINNSFLKAALRLVEHIENPSKTFVALYFVSNYAPEGADQVEATYECYKYVMKNEHLITETKYKDRLEKIKRKYPILKTQHLLYVYGLNDEKLLQLVEDPTELICKLYHHEMVLKPSKLDINKVVKEIAELHELNLQQIQMQLVQKWLSFTLDTPDDTVLEDTFFEEQPFEASSGENPGNATECVIRANYILNSWPKEQAIQFIVGHMHIREGTINTLKLLQMYECLSQLNDGSGQLRSVLNQRQYIAIKCVHELKQLGYTASVDKFAENDKLEILKTIWQRQGQNPKALVVLANICTGYNIYLPPIWNGVLKRMVQFKMVRELNALVDLLSCQPQLLTIEGLCLAWEHVLKYPFSNAIQTRSQEQEEKLCKALLRLQTCPVLGQLNLFDFAEQCIVLQRPHLAAIVMALCKNPEQRAEIKKMIVLKKSEKLAKEILDLEDAGILPAIINESVKELNLE